MTARVVRRLRLLDRGELITFLTALLCLMSYTFPSV